MRIINVIIMSTVTLATMFGHAGDSAPFVLDNATSPSGESVILPWNAEWIGGNANATAVITDNGNEVKRANGSGEFTLNNSCGNHQLEYSTFIGGVKQGETYTAEAELTHIAAETKAAKAATCTEVGWTHEVRCSRCNAMLDTSTTIPALGHVEVESKSAKSATCSEYGWTQEMKCSRCNAILEESTVISALGHIEIVTKPAVQATSSTAGMTAEISCSRCGVVLQEQKVIPRIINVAAKQRYPWNGKVDITYDVQGDVTEWVSGSNNVSLIVMATNRLNGTRYVTEGNALSGETGTAQGAHHVVWDLNAQGIGFKSDDVVFTVAYSLYSRYCVIDLSSGVTAASYPVTYMNVPPVGGFNADAYKTTNLVLRLIEPGSFMMGGQYDVTLTKPFYCGIFEVTQKQYELVTGSNPSQYKGDMRPVERVKWGDASTFAGKIQTRTGLNFDMPTEAQWEYACRAGTTGKYNNGGDTENDLKQLGRYSGNRSDGRGGYSDAHTKVGSYQPNAWGLYDMLGNAWEWCLDRYGELSSGVTDPVGPSSAWGLVRRGGAWGNNADECTSSQRVGNFSTYNTDNGCGFRLARTLFGTENEQGSGVEQSAILTGDSTSVAIDSRVGVDNRRVDAVPWDASWIGGNVNATVVIKDDGAEVKRATGAGEFSLSVGRHDLTYATFISNIAQTECYSATVYRCSCELSLGDVPLVETKSAKATTCTEAGWTHEVKCSRCNAALEASMAIPALGHVEVETKAAKAATCTDDGWTHEVKCSRCNAVFEASTTIPALGHVEVETKAAKAATCTEAGWTHEVKCSRCNKVLEASTTIPALGHVRRTTVTAIDPTCTTDGRTAEVECTRCDAMLEVSSVVPALGHVRQTTISAIEPTCTADGRTAEVVCSRCGVTLETSEVVPALGHSGAITKPAVEATSSTAGVTAEITCTRCGTVLQAQTTIPALGYIRNLTARQLWPHKKVEVCYEVAEDIREVATSATLPTITCKYGSTTKTANSSRIYGDTACKPGNHRIVWDFEGQSISINQSSVAFTVGYSSVSGVSSVVAVNTSSSVANGMSVAGTVELGYSPFADGEVTVMVDDVAVLSSTNSGVFAWQPRTTGTYTLKHVSGNYTWTRTVNVTSLAYDTPPAPNPPTAADANIAIGSTSKAFTTPSAGSGSITTSGSGKWTASVSDSWITIPSALTSRNAGLPVVYQVTANAGVEERTGYIYVSGHVFTITQAGVGAALDGYSADLEMEGGSGSFTVLADAQTEWKVRSNVDWISVSVEGTGNGEWGTVGVGEQRVLYNVAPFNEISTRSGTITAAGCTFTVNQTGRRMKLVVAEPGGTAGSASQPYHVERDYLSHVIAVTVNALAATQWDVEVDGTWISVVDAGRGHGGGNVSIAINENPSWLARSGTVRIGTEVLTINQAGRPSAALEFGISPEDTTASVKGANALISVTATPDLPWTAQSQANWLTIMPSFQSGAGDGNVVYAASPNPTMAARTGAIRVEAATSAALPAKSHTVTQPAATAMISASSHTFNAAGESFGVEVTTDDIVNWTVVENIGWISVVGSTSRIGAGTVTLAASENLTVNSREASVTIAGHPFAVLQKGRTVEVEYESRVFGTASDYATLDVHPDGNVQWVAVSSDPTWLTIWGDDGCDYDDYGNVIATGDHTIEYIVTDYVGDGTPRTGTITIGDKTVYITQRPYDLSINPSAATVSGNAGAGSVGVPASVGQVWDAIATEPWIVIESGYDSGTGSGTVRYTYTDNDTGETRTGKIIIAGEAYTITQAARQMVSVNATARVVTASGEPTAGNGGVVSGAGTYDRGTSVTLTAVANDGYSFVNWMLPDGSVLSGGILATVADVDKEIIASFRRIPVYSVNGEGVREGTSKTFTAPADVIDENGTRKLVCRGTSRYPDKGTSFTLVVTEDIDFEWDLWTTNYLVTVEQFAGGTILSGGSRPVATGIWVAAGTAIDLTAIPDSGQHFFRWQLRRDGELLSLLGDSEFGSNGDSFEASPNLQVSETPSSESNNGSVSLCLCIKTPLSVSAIFGTFNDTLATALDAPALTFTTGGDAAWLPVIDATAQTGYTSARSGTIGVESETWLDMTVEGAGTLTFRWRVDCEKDDGGGTTWDRLAVFTNGVEVARIDGKTDWQTVTIELPNSPTPNSPTQTLIRWSFYRDDFDEPGQSHENCGWVDNIVFTK